MAYKLTFQYLDTKSEDWCEMTLWGETKDAAYRSAYKWVGSQDITVVSLEEVEIA